jgi:hypothetical protein
MGVLIWTGELFLLNSEAQQFLDGLGLNFFSDVGFGRLASPLTRLRRGEHG